jgi:hypothetical protein
MAGDPPQSFAEIGIELRVGQPLIKVSRLAAEDNIEIDGFSFIHRAGPLPHKFAAPAPQTVSHNGRPDVTGQSAPQTNAGLAVGLPLNQKPRRRRDLSPFVAKFRKVLGCTQRNHGGHGTGISRLFSADPNDKTLAAFGAAAG